MIIRSGQGNEKKIVMTMINHGTLNFRVRGDLPDVWTIKCVSTPLNALPELVRAVKLRFGPDVDGVFPDADLMPLTDPGVFDWKQEQKVDALNAKLDKLRFDEKIRKVILRKTNTG